MNIIWNLLGAILIVTINLVEIILCALYGRLGYATLINVALLIIFAMYGRFLLKSKVWRLQFFPEKSTPQDGIVLLPTLLFFKRRNAYLNGVNKFCEFAASLVFVCGVRSTTISLGYASFDPTNSEFMRRNRADHISSDRPKI